MAMEPIDNRLALALPDRAALRSTPSSKHRVIRRSRLGSVCSGSGVRIRGFERLMRRRHLSEVTYTRKISHTLHSQPCSGRVLAYKLATASDTEFPTSATPLRRWPSVARAAAYESAGTHHLHQFDLVKLVVTNHPAGVLPAAPASDGNTACGTRTSAAVAPPHDLVAHQVRHRHFRVGMR